MLSCCCSSKGVLWTGSTWCFYRGLKDLIKEAQKEIESQGTVAFSPRTTSLTVVRPRAQKPADERFFEKLEAEVGSPATLHSQAMQSKPPPERSRFLGTRQAAQHPGLPGECMLLSKQDGSRL